MILLSPFAFVFMGLVSLRNRLYESGWLKSYSLPPKVIAVGNLSVGGTGKTSFVIWLMRVLSQKGLKVGVISRGYGKALRQISEVAPSSDPRVFGDEPCLIANERLGPIFVGSNRHLAGQELLEKYKVDVILADDAFQHRRLRRDLDIVLLDASQPKSHFHMLPWGRLREPFSSLKRAHVVVLSKRKLGSQEDLSWLQMQIPSDRLQLEMNYGIEDLVPYEGPKALDLEARSFLLVSGVARPEGVSQLVGSRFQVCSHLKYKDHHSYTESDAKEILKKMKDKKADFILTTEKDAVKLGRFDLIKNCLYVIKLRYEVEGSVDDFIEMVRRKNR